LGFIYSLTPLLQADEVNLYTQMADVAANKDSKYLAEIFVKSSSEDRVCEMYGHQV
jgi:hypothetical protein